MYKKLVFVVGVLLILCSATALAQREATTQMSAISKDIASASVSMKQPQSIYSENFVLKRLPDLRVTQVIPGTPSFESGSVVNVPLTVTIKNFGASTKESFKISVDAQVDGGPRYVKPFTVPRQSDMWYPWQNGLAGGAEVTFTGNLQIGTPSGDSLSGKSAIIYVIVDSISGDEFIADSGRVMESNEENNEKMAEIQL